MDRLALIGISHRRGGLALVEACQRCGQGLERLAEVGVREWVLIATCNRWDVVLALPAGLSLEVVRAHLGSVLRRPYAYLGEAALEQLARVASSLDSLNPGEDQIMAQVRKAFTEAQQRGTTGPVTSFAFHAALRIAKQVRRELALSPGNTSLFSLARPSLEAALSPSDTVVILGAGPLATLAAKSLAGRPEGHTLIVNRTPERGAALARQVGAESCSLADFLARPPAVRALVCALAAPGLVDAALLRRLSELELVVDLGLPRNVQLGAAEAAGVRLLDLEALEAAGQARREALAEKLAAAECLIQQEVEKAQAEWTERQLGPSIQKLRALYLTTIDNHMGDQLPPEAAERLAHRFAHVPVKGLKALARTYGLDAARLFLAETGLAE